MMRSTVLRITPHQRGGTRHVAEIGIASLPLLRSEKKENGKPSIPVPIHRRVVGGELVSTCHVAQRQLSQYVMDHGLLGYPPLWYTETDLRSTKPWLSIDTLPHAVICVVPSRELELVHISAVDGNHRSLLLADLPPPSLDVSVEGHCTEVSYLELQYDSEGDPRRLRWSQPMNRKAFYAKCEAVVDHHSDVHSDSAMAARCLGKDCAEPPFWIHTDAARHMQLAIGASHSNDANRRVTQVRFVAQRGAFLKLFHFTKVPKN